MSYVVRYVDVNFEKGTTNIVESFLGFLPLDKKDAHSMSVVIKEQLAKDQLNFSFCRAQCYDNANVMAGNKSGLHTIMRRENELALFLNCNNHSLNLVGIHATKNEPVLGSFYLNIDSLFNFFARSTIRWGIFKNEIKVSLHSQSETRWSARYEAVKPVFLNFKEILNLLENMSENEELNSDTRQDAFALAKRLSSYDFIILLEFWYLILGKLDTVQKRLQNPKMNFKDAALDIDGLHKHFVDSRDTIVEQCLTNGIELCNSLSVPVSRRSRKVSNS